MSSGTHWHVAWFPPSNPHKIEPAAMLSLDWAAIHDGAPARFSCQVQVACSDPLFLMPRALFPLTFIVSYAKSMYGPQCMDFTNVQKWVRVYVLTYRCP